MVTAVKVFSFYLVNFFVGIFLGRCFLRYTISHIWNFVKQRPRRKIIFTNVRAIC